MSQKLTLKARAAKAARDLQYANSPDRKANSADRQKKLRAAKKAGLYLTNLDYDHKDGKFKSVKANRGNDGKGTKKEKRKRIT